MTNLFLSSGVVEYGSSYIVRRAIRGMNVRKGKRVGRRSWVGLTKRKDFYI